jgi:dipeptidyl aminopeptidase/acylaminoacyl peptidase
VKRFLLAAAALATTLGARAALPPLIPREVLFGRAARTQPLLSPDGTRLAWLAADAEGAANVWVQSIGGDDARVVTRERHRPVSAFQWAHDGVHLLYVQDGDGDENDHVFLADLEGKNVRDLTPFRGVKATNLLVSAARPHEILVGLNLRDRASFDMYRVSLETGAVTLEAENPGDVLSWSTDPQFVIRGATAFDRTSGRTSIRVRDSAAAPWRELLSWPFEQSHVYYGQAYDGTMILSFARDGATVDVLSGTGSNTLRAVRVDAKSGRELAVLASDPRSDPGDDGSITRPLALIDPATGALQAIAYEYLLAEWKFVDQSLREHLTRIAAETHGFPIPISRDAAGRRWLVEIDRSDAPPSYVFYDRATKQLTKLFDSSPELARYTLAPVQPVVIRARDGAELVSYLTLPPGVAPRNLPLIIHPHGGPFVRDRAIFDPHVQLMANRGYAVLQVNYRGSEGFGRRFTNLFTRQWGRGTHDDLLDAIQWAVRRGIADPKRIVALGASGGGYAAMRALTQSPELFAAGVAISAPTNVRVMIESFPPYWGPSRERFIRRIGDVIHDEAFNREISPFFHVARIRAPLLIQQGANDPRVPIAQADALVAALREAGREVTYVVYPDEGHGLRRVENEVDFWGRAEMFLAKYAGGRAEPWTKVDGATAEVR